MSSHSHGREFHMDGGPGVLYSIGHEGGISNADKSEIDWAPDNGIIATAL
jgi:hypothetical protein